MAKYVKKGRKPSRYNALWADLLLMKPETIYISSEPVRESRNIRSLLNQHPILGLYRWSCLPHGENSIRIECIGVWDVPDRGDYDQRETDALARIFA